MRRHEETDSDQMKQYYESYMREVPCQACQGRRLRPEVLAVTVGGESIADVCDMSAEKSLAWVNSLQLEGSAAQIAGGGAQGDPRPLGLLNDVGLNYLTLSPRGQDALRRRGAAHPDWPRRSVRAWSASCTCLTSRPSACTSATTNA